jgi:hypothetical protein
MSSPVALSSVGSVFGRFSPRQRSSSDQADSRVGTQHGPASASSFCLAGNREALRAAASFLSARREAASSSPVHPASVPVSPMRSAQPREPDVGTPLDVTGPVAAPAATDGDAIMGAPSQRLSV